MAQLRRGLGWLLAGWLLVGCSTLPKECINTEPKMIRVVLNSHGYVSGYLYDFGGTDNLWIIWTSGTVTKHHQQGG